MKFLDTKIWATARIEQGVVSFRIHAAGCAGAREDGSPILAVKSFDVDPPEALKNAMEVALESRKEELEAAAKTAAFDARKVAVDRREVKEVT